MRPLPFVLLVALSIAVGSLAANGVIRWADERAAGCRDARTITLTLPATDPTSSRDSVTLAVRLCAPR